MTAAATCVLLNSAPKRGSLAAVDRKYKRSHNVPARCSEKRNVCRVSAGKQKEKRTLKSHRRTWEEIDHREYRKGDVG